MARSLRQVHVAVVFLAAALTAARPTAAPSERTAPDTTATLVISVSGLPGGTAGRITVSGPEGFTREVAATTTIDGLAAGSYTVSAARVMIDGTPWEGSPRSQVAVIAVDSVARVEVTYKLAPPPLSAGTLTLNIDGLPAGANANLALSALGGFSQPIVHTTTLTNLLPRAYAVSAAYVTWHGTTYAPTPAKQVVTVAPADSTGVTVQYAPAPVGAFPALAPGFQARAIEFKGSTYNYQIFVPRGYTPEYRWPIILFAHGSGEKGSDNTAQTNVGLGHYVRAHASTFPAVVVFPQQAAGQPYADFDSMMVVMLDATMREAHIDSTRQYLTGVSAGGARLWWLAYHDSTRYAALAPLSALVAPREFGVTSQTAALALIVPALRLLPIRQYNGSEDTQVRIATYAFPIHDAFSAAGAPHYTFIQVPGGTHGSTWDTAYADPEFWKWLFAQRR